MWEYLQNGYLCLRFLSKGAHSSAGSEHPAHRSGRVGGKVARYQRLDMNPKSRLKYVDQKTKGAHSSAGSEHLPYKQGVGGSNPSAPTH